MELSTAGRKSSRTWSDVHAPRRTMLSAFMSVELRTCAGKKAFGAGLGVLFTTALTCTACLACRCYSIQSNIDAMAPAVARLYEEFWYAVLRLLSLGCQSSLPCGTDVVNVSSVCHRATVSTTQMATKAPAVPVRLQLCLHRHHATQHTATMGTHTQATSGWWALWHSLVQWSNACQKSCSRWCVTTSPCTL